MSAEMILDLALLVVAVLVTTPVVWWALTHERPRPQWAMPPVDAHPISSNDLCGLCARPGHEAGPLSVVGLCERCAGRPLRLLSDNPPRDPAFEIRARVRRDRRPA